MNRIPDIRAESHGTIWLIRGVTDAGEAWMRERVDSVQFWGRSSVVEWRYVTAIVDGARDDGLDVEVRS